MSNLGKNITLCITSVCLAAFLLFHFASYIDIYQDMSTTDMTMYMVIAITTAVTLASIAGLMIVVSDIAWSVIICVLLLALVIMIAFNTFYSWAIQPQGSRVTYLVFMVIFILLIGGAVATVVMGRTRNMGLLPSQTVTLSSS